MIPVTTRKGQKLALFGLGGSGMVTARALLAGGASVIAFDDNPASVEIAKSEGIPVGDLREVDFTTLDGLVLAPGVPLTHPHPHWSVDLASRAGIEIIGDVGLFAQERRAVAPDCAFIAITGTNGKSTTTALISHILREAGKDVQMGGNIGKAVLSLEPLAFGRIYVVECSSYQIDLAPGLDPSIGILLNLAPDHLDRHGTMENYAAIKSRLVAGSQQAVIGIDDTYCRNIERMLAENGPTLPLQISVKAETGNGYYFKDGFIFRGTPGVAGYSLNDAPTLRGIHNAQNALAAVATCNLLGVDAQPGLKTFPGLAHRMEILGNVGKTVYVNDSKGTNADAAAMALGSFENIYWIAGGLPKDGGIENLRDYFPRVRKAFLIGEAAGQFAATLGDGVSYEISGDLASAVLSVASETQGAEAVVLLSPACASFDQFRNFEARGEAFREAVARLEGFVAFGGTSK